MWLLIWKGIKTLTGSGLIEHLATIYTTKKNSALESERIEADKAKAQLDAILTVRLATAGFWEMRLLTFMIAFPFALHALLVGIDTSFNFIDWRIPAYPAPFHEWEGTILLSFFGVYTAGRGITQIASAVATRKR